MCIAFLMVFCPKTSLAVTLAESLVFSFQNQNKKVLLRECKRHTGHRVASAHYADLSPDGGSTPSSPGWGTPSSPGQRGYPIQSSMGVPPSTIQSSMEVPCGNPPHQQDGGYPPQSAGWGYPLHQQDGVPLSRSEMGYLHPDLGWGILRLELEWGNLPPPPHPDLG